MIVAAGRISFEDASNLPIGSRVHWRSKWSSGGWFKGIYLGQGFWLSDNPAVGVFYNSDLVLAISEGIADGRTELLP